MEELVPLRMGVGGTRGRPKSITGAHTAAAEIMPRRKQCPKLLLGGSSWILPLITRCRTRLGEIL